MMEHVQKRFAAVLLAAVLMASAGFVHAADSHTPRFSWEVRGSVVHQEQWIYDRDIPVAMFENRTVEQPGLQLMFFNRVKRPLMLRHVRLTPESEPLVECIQLYTKCGPVVTDKLVDLKVDGNGTDRLVVTFVTEDPFRVLTDTRVLTLTWDSEKETYVYDFDGLLTFNSPESFNGSAVSFEFCDPWFTGSPAPAVEFPGMWAKRYQKIVYEASDGVKEIPINHYTTSHKNGIRLKPDGMFVAAYEPDGNPAIQFVGDTADKASISICWWGYDYHLSKHIAPSELFGPVPFRFRILKCPDTKVKQLMSDAVMPELRPDEWRGWNEYPVYERVSSFEKGLRLDSSFDGPIDPYPWTVTGDGAEWDRSTGRTGSSSLKISRDSAGLTRWLTFQGDGEGYYTGPWTPCKGYRVSCYVKTENVTGRGSTLAVQYHIPNSPQQHPVVTAKRVKGSADWTRLDIEVGPPKEGPELGCIQIFLQQDGSGTTWFDDLEVVPIQ